MFGVQTSKVITANPSRTSLWSWKSTNQIFELKSLILETLKKQAFEFELHNKLKLPKDVVDKIYDLHHLDSFFGRWKTLF